MSDWTLEEGNNYLMLNDISAYKISFALSNYIWDIIIKWNYFEKDTVGKQFVRAIDSISANIAEGFGRYSKKEKIHFYRYSFGSLKESQDWNEKAKFRNLLSAEQYQHISAELTKLPREINYLIKYTDEKLKI
jgi:four helix bundle protein